MKIWVAVIGQVGQVWVLILFSLFLTSIAFKIMSMLCPGSKVCMCWDDSRICGFSVKFLDFLLRSGG